MISIFLQIFIKAINSIAKFESQNYSNYEKLQNLVGFLNEYCTPKVGLKKLLIKYLYGLCSEGFYINKLSFYQRKIEPLLIQMMKQQLLVIILGVRH